MVNKLEFKALLVRKDIKFKDVARACGITYGALNKKLTKGTVFSFNQVCAIQRLAQLTDTEIKELFGMNI